MTKTILLAASLLMALPAHATTIGSEEVSGFDISAPVGNVTYRWGYHYTLDFDGTTLTKHVGISFVFDPGFTPAQQTAFRSAAETNIEQIWNNQYVVRDTLTNQIIPVAVDVREGPINETVRVISGNGRGDMLNWYQDYIGQSPTLMAHEFGHMLGLYDEYPGGALDPRTLLTDAQGVMGYGALYPNPVMYPRYYGEYAEFLTRLEGDPFVLVAAGDAVTPLAAVPEPSTWVFLVTGLVGLFFTRRWSNENQARLSEVVSGLVDSGDHHPCVHRGDYERAARG